MGGPYLYPYLKLIRCCVHKICNEANFSVSHTTTLTISVSVCVLLCRASCWKLGENFTFPVGIDKFFPPSSVGKVDGEGIFFRMDNFEQLGRFSQGFCVLGCSNWRWLNAYWIRCTLKRFSIGFITVWGKIKARRELTSSRKDIYSQSFASWTNLW